VDNWPRSGWSRTSGVVPEVNGAEVANRLRGMIANPNCTTLSMIVVLGALHQAYQLTDVVAASYQAASGAGQAGADTLRH
jgi:aspartate-semialdehyde dehydrogenase